MPTFHPYSQAQYSQHIFCAVLTVIAITFLPLNSQHIYNNCSRLARAPLRSLSVKTPLAPLGSPRDNEMETVSGFTMNQINILTN